MKTLKINKAIVFPKAILLTFFSILLAYGPQGLVTWVGFLGLGFSVDGVWGLGVGPSGFIGVWDLCVNIEE